LHLGGRLFLTDAANALVPDYRIEGRGDCPQNTAQCARLRAFSLWPRDACDVGASFPNLFDESRNNLAGTMRLKKPLDRYPERFIGKPGLGIEASTLTFANRRSIRLGALDLILAPADAAGATVTEKIFFEMQFERDAAALPQERQLNVSLQTVMHLAQVLPGGEDAPSSGEFKTTTGPTAETGKSNWLGVNLKLASC